MRYNVIIKANADTFLKYRNVSDLLKLTYWLDVNWPGWRFFNVFDSKSKNQIASFTNKNRPQKSKIEY